MSFTYGYFCSCNILKEFNLGLKIVFLWADNELQEIHSCSNVKAQKFIICLLCRRQSILLKQYFYCLFFKKYAWG